MTGGGHAPMEGSAGRVAVVGSGLAGLATAWLLGRDRSVVLYEAHPTVGMGAHSLRVEGASGPVAVDMPLRVFTPGYYPTLLSLFEHVGIRTETVDYAASFSELGGSTYFRYVNLRVAGRSLPVPSPSAARSTDGRRIVRDLLRFHRHAPAHLGAGCLSGRTIGQYLDDEDFSPAFIEGFVLPAYASICTCRTDTARHYPAEVVVEYMCSGVVTLGVQRAARGTEDVGRRLTAPVDEMRLGEPVRRVIPVEDGVDVVSGSGRSERFDQVVLAVRADQAADLLPDDDELGRVLRRVPHESSRVVVHRDPCLAPRDRQAWSPVNFIVDPDGDAPMATIWLDRVQPGLGSGPALFQTWNPLREPDSDTVVAEARFVRPVVGLETRGVPALLIGLQDDPRRRIWPVGSYAQAGIPLLEAAAFSAVRVARHLGATIPFPFDT